MAEALLDISGLAKAYGALHVTAGVDLAVRPGEIHALIGPNGAGKTTLVGQIAGEVMPDAGTIRFDGADITRLPVHRRARLGLARAFQITSIFPRFTALEHAALAVMAARGRTFRLLRPAASSRAARAEVAAAALSHGEKRALELAMALAARPRLMLLDEPMAGTGPAESSAMVALLTRLKGRCAILLVEHDMDAVFRLADRISVLVNGRIIACGTPDAVRADAAVRAAYLGDGE
ncbi:ATP-binding cassette domain-containing protein [Xanthobacter autotrophicus]|uniref:ABC transporter ATP-binding protein n=1 Tax=Xanthobacter autotrophicus TaxID=280 RepID=UPI001E552899|nr:ATP-binding cassette domain-containing protein [Xanthobacter autotrophicus]UDQ90298.1 ATP-binding cassette domain-containing protein [Xanthobacter autotrophicus]